MPTETESLGPYVFVALLVTCALYLVGYALVVLDMRKKYPEFCKKLDGTRTLVWPKKQMDLMSWIMSRNYAEGSAGRFHRYDLFLAVFILFVLNFIALAVIYS